MTVLERLAANVRFDPEWTDLIPDVTGDNADVPTCQDWGRKGGSHYKDGQFTKK